MSKHDGRPGDPSSLAQRIAEARTRQTAADQPDPAKRRLSSGYGMAMRLAIEMVAALAVSVGLGLWLDAEFGVAPLFLIVFIPLGMAAGILNVYKTVTGFTHGELMGSAGHKPASRPEDRKGDERGD